MGEWKIDNPIMKFFFVIAVVNAMINIIGWIVLFFLFILNLIFGGV